MVLRKWHKKIPFRKNVDKLSKKKKKGAVEMVHEEIQRTSTFACLIQYSWNIFANETNTKKLIGKKFWPSLDSNKSLLVLQKLLLT